MREEWNLEKDLTHISVRDEEIGIVTIEPGSGCTAEVEQVSASKKFEYCCDAIPFIISELIPRHIAPLQLEVARLDTLCTDNEDFCFVYEATHPGAKMQVP
jgi:hypothetical protein